MAGSSPEPAKSQKITTHFVADLALAITFALGKLDDQFFGT